MNWSGVTAATMLARRQAVYAMHRLGRTSAQQAGAAFLPSSSFSASWCSHPHRAGCAGHIDHCSIGICLPQLHEACWEAGIHIQAD